jgi:hypothetical protein
MAPAAIPTDRTNKILTYVLHAVFLSKRNNFYLQASTDDRISGIRESHQMTTTQQEDYINGYHAERATEIDRGQLLLLLLFNDAVCIDMIQRQS